VLKDPNALVIGRIERIVEEKVTIIDHLPDPYHDYLDLFTTSTAEKLAPPNLGSTYRSQTRYPTTLGSDISVITETTGSPSEIP